MKKRMELASRATAIWLNNSVFGMAGPVKSLARYLGATGDRAGECLLEDILPPGFELSIFPYSDTEAASRPLVKGRYKPEMHLAIGMLRTFNAEHNNVEANSPPQCDFRRAPYIEGAANLDAYGPLFFVMMRTILPKLSPKLGEMICNAKTPEEVCKVMQSTFTR
jgi:hypothetical protein